jgi:hypothetical protein
MKANGWKSQITAQMNCKLNFIGSLPWTNMSAILLTPHVHKTENLDFKYTTLPIVWGLKINCSQTTKVKQNIIITISNTHCYFCKRGWRFLTILLHPCISNPYTCMPLFIYSLFIFLHLISQAWIWSSTWCFTWHQFLCCLTNLPSGPCITHFHIIQFHQIFL